jgi:putative addiction module CopG family antidote
MGRAGTRGGLAGGRIDAFSGVRYNASMNVRLKPETEKLIQQDLQNGVFRSVDEYVEHAVSLLHQREAWLAENRAEISAKIEEGYAEARRGELLSEHEVRSSMEEHKKSWLEKRRKE